MKRKVRNTIEYLNIGGYFEISAGMYDNESVVLKPIDEARVTL